MGLCNVIIVFYLSIHLGHSANILGVFPVPSKSHDILGSALFKHLAGIGHNVTYISTFAHKDQKNFNSIYVQEAAEYLEANIKKVTHGNVTLLGIFSKAGSFGNIAEAIFENQSVKKLLESDAQYDLMIHFMGIDSTLALAHRFDVPVIVLAPVGGFQALDRLMGNPTPASYVPNVLLPFTDDMNLLERTINSLMSFVATPLIDILLKKASDKLIEKYMPGYPTHQELTKRIELVLLNTDISSESPRPYVPNMIQIGGFHLQKPEPLENDLKKILDEAKEGFVYLSFGTNVKMSELPRSTLDVLKKVLGDLPLKVIMKYDDDQMANKPLNFHLGKWFPQPSVLAHPNAKLFISHGGYGGCTESLFYGVPMLCIPFFGDQPKNCADAEYNGYSITVKLDDLNEKTLSNALQKVLYDQKFKEAVSFKSELYRNQPMNPMDKAVYWIEHVIKHKGAKHLKVRGVELPWYQHYLLDVFLFIGAVLFIVLSVIFYICKFILKKLCSRSNKIKTS